jgi:hypothetical protein
MGLENPRRPAFRAAEVCNVRVYPRKEGILRENRLPVGVLAARDVERQDLRSGRLLPAVRGRR